MYFYVFLNIILYLCICVFGIDTAIARLELLNLIDEIEKNKRSEEHV